MKKIVSKSVLLSFFIVSLHAQQTILLPVFKDGKVGYIDRSGKQVIPAVFDQPRYGFEVHRICDGLMLVEKDKKFGFIDAQGKQVIAPTFEVATDFNHGYAIVQTLFKKEYESTVINKKGQYLMTPVPGSLEWRGDLLLNTVYKASGMELRLLNVTGDVLAAIEKVPEIYKDGEANRIINEFKLAMFEGLVEARAGTKFGFKNKDNRFVIAAQYDSVWHFSENLAAVKKKDRWGFIDHSNKMVIKPQFDEVHPAGFMNNHCFVKWQNKWGWIDRQGQWVVTPMFDDVKKEIFRDGLIGVKIDTLWGFMDTTGRIAIKPQFWNVRHFSEGYGIYNARRAPQFNDRTGFGYIDRTGKVLLKATNVDAEDFDHGIAFMVYATSDGRDPFPVDKKFKEILPNGRIWGTNDSLWAVQNFDKDHYGLFHKTKRKYVIEPKYLKMILTPYDIVYVVFSKTDKDFEYGYLDYSGKVIFRSRETGKYIE
jgi:hypothetical protein